MLQNAGFQALAEHVAGRVHPSALDDAAAAARHRDVILTHLLVGVTPFAALPVLFALGAGPSGLGLAAFAWLTAHIAAAFHLSSTGRLDVALGAGAAAFATLAAVGAAATGGLASPALALLILPLIDAGLAGSRRGGLVAAMAAAAAALAVAGLQFAGWLQPAQPGLAAALGIASAAYAAALAARGAALVRAAEDARGPSEATFELFAGSIGDLVTRHAAGGAVAFASTASRDLLGATPRDLLGAGLFERVHIADRPAYLHGLSAAAESDDAAPVELRLRVGPAGAASTFAWTEMRARRVRLHEVGAESAARAPVVAAFRSVADRKAYEFDLVEAREQAEAASLAKTRFLAHMSHELRTPLNAIIGFSEVLADESLCRLTPERRADYATLIHRSGAHLLEVVNSILDMAKIESGAFAIDPRACAVGPIVAHCVEVMRLKAETAEVSLTVAPGPDAPEIEADPRAVTQIVLNLLANAVKFTPRGGAVTVEVAGRANGVAVSVRDTGVGIAPENIGRLGEAFYQASDTGRRHEGAGLGLSVVRGLVTLHGGDMAVESAIGRGTVVTIFLPSAATRDDVVRPLPASARKVRLSA